jgi:hypothetical protein
LRNSFCKAKREKGEGEGGREEERGGGFSTKPKNVYLRKCPVQFFRKENQHPIIKINCPLGIHGEDMHSTFPDTCFSTSSTQTSCPGFSPASEHQNKVRIWDMSSFIPV